MALIIMNTTNDLIAYRLDSGMLIEEQHKKDKNEIITCHVVRGCKWNGKLNEAYNCQAKSISWCIVRILLKS